MTTLGDSALRELALRVLTQHAGPAPGADAIAAATRRAYADLALVSTPLIGHVGVEAVTGRAVRLAQREYSWLVDPRAPERSDEAFAQVIVSLGRQDPGVATDGAAAVFATLVRLLITFIGESLTTELLRKAWPTAFSDTHAEEK